MKTSTLSSDVELAAARSRLYGMLAAILKYPDISLVEFVQDHAACASVRDAAAEVSARQSPRLSEEIEIVMAHFRRKALVELEDAYLRTFGASPRGRVTAYECEYGSSEIFQFSSELSDITAFYSAFGLCSGDGQERLDHISTECEFMRILCAKEAHLLSEADRAAAEHLEVTRDAQKNFMHHHLGRWAAAFARQLTAADPDGPYGSAARALEEFILKECGRWSISVGPAFLPLREIPPADDPSNCISCGKAEGLPGQIPESSPEEQSAD